MKLCRQKAIIERDYNRLIQDNQNTKKVIVKVNIDDHYRHNYLPNIRISHIPYNNPRNPFQ